MNRLFDFLDKRITIAPNNGNLFMVCGRYRLDSQEYKCRLEDIKFVEFLIYANNKMEEDHRYDLRILQGESIYFDFTIEDQTEIFRAPISHSLHNKIMDRLILADNVFHDYSVSFVLSKDVEVDEIDIVDEFMISTKVYDIVNNNSILIDVVITCQDYIPESSEMISKMRQSIISSIIE